MRLAPAASGPSSSWKVVRRGAFGRLPSDMAFCVEAAGGGRRAETFLAAGTSALGYDFWRDLQGWAFVALKPHVVTKKL